ncbi:dihydrolipoyl dehydrogenase [Sporolactobacillus spathodeae]|uniref:Dihydrolipoyl dehydrogenase n=1 Tax=Sporolactobacillus spathodeae TaxID=1465502 RepID=A0ABS2Q988_9BACL|nr:dihydrolipoyl dehydrogenase [Sporolactobacillus spathodeae]MBM7657890.1 dihydrolipoamide dehydrogenase [Sporolactobacillus spathodeae]
MAENYDLVLLGGGTGGYVAAIRASQLGLKTAIVEKEALGGTCLHKGCIPTKAFLRSAEVFATIKQSSSFGVDVSGAVLDFNKIQERKKAIVEKLHQGVLHLMKKGKIDIYEGFGRMLGPSIFSPLAGTISVEYADGRENSILTAKNVILATGSRPRPLGSLVFDGVHVLSSDDALNLVTCPQSIIIVGGGVIGVEWASMMADFGVDVTVLEYADRLIPTEDAGCAKLLQTSFKKRGIKVITGAQVLPDSFQCADGVQITAVKNAREQTFSAEKMLVSIGRLPNSEDIGLSNTSIETEKGLIKVNAFGQTKESHIYAIGDVIGGLQLAHVAAREGIQAVDHLAGQKVMPMAEAEVPRCIYTRPEIASIGLGEDEAKRHYSIKVGKVPFAAIGKALVYGESDGYAKIIADKVSDDILGIQLIGPHATDLIGEASLAKLLNASPWEIAQAIHPHPTLNEVLGEAALAVDGQAIHL